jgi:hypothetical protein
MLSWPYSGLLSYTIDNAFYQNGKCTLSVSFSCGTVLSFSLYVHLAPTNPSSGANIAPKTTLKGHIGWKPIPTVDKNIIKNKAYKSPGPNISRSYLKPKTLTKPNQTKHLKTIT